MSAIGTSDVAVVMPAYNAGRTVERVFTRIPPSARARIGSYVVADDGSVDDTRAALERLRRDFPRMVVLEHARNLGYGATMKTLLGYARERRFGATAVLHADGQYSPEFMLDLLAPIEVGGADVVQGSRLLGGGALAGGMPLYKYVANRLLTALENRAFGKHLAEYHSGYMLYSRRALERIPFERFANTFVFDLEMLIAAFILGLTVRELPVPTIYADEISHLRPLRYGLEVLAVVRRYRRGDYHALLGAGGKP